MKERVRTLLRASNKYLPHWPAPHVETNAVAVCVYRSKNAHHVLRMIRQLPGEAEIRLHALDDVVLELEALTVSTGPGMRTDLLQKLVDSKPISSSDWVVLFDDDCTFSLTGRTKFLEFADRAELDVAGASIDVHQPHSFDHTVVRPFSLVRTVSLVEIGPIVALSPNAQSKILPFPDHAGMGWGLDVLWSTLGLQMGYVDATPIQHHGEVAASYDTEFERIRLENYLQEAGHESIHELIGTKERWQTWRPRPQWASRPKRTS